MRDAVKAQAKERFQVYKRQTRYDYTKGPMKFLGQQIVKKMEDAGYPSKIFCCFRSPSEQQRVFDKGNSKARPYRSPHQFYEAVDIVHAKLYWNASQEYWDTLAAVVKIVEEQFGVELEHGYDWGWDSAHIEMKDWRGVRDAIGHNMPTQRELDERFAQKLPQLWKSYKSRALGRDTPEEVRSRL